KRDRPPALRADTDKGTDVAAPPPVLELDLSDPESRGACDLPQARRDRRAPEASRLRDVDTERPAGRPARRDDGILARSGAALPAGRATAAGGVRPPPAPPVRGGGGGGAGAPPAPPRGGAPAPGGGDPRRAERLEPVAPGRARRHRSCTVDRLERRVRLRV